MVWSSVLCIHYIYRTCSARSYILYTTVPLPNQNNVVICPQEIIKLYYYIILLHSIFITHYTRRSALVHSLKLSFIRPPAWYCRTSPCNIHSWITSKSMQVQYLIIVFLVHVSYISNYNVEQCPLYCQLCIYERYAEDKPWFSFISPSRLTKQFKYVYNIYKFMCMCGGTKLEQWDRDRK